MYKLNMFVKVWFLCHMLSISEAFMSVNTELVLLPECQYELAVFTRGTAPVTILLQYQQSDIFSPPIHHSSEESTVKHIG